MYNAFTNDSFVEKLKTRLNLRGLVLIDGQFFHIRCCEHILNLIVQDGFKKMYPSIHCSGTRSSEFQFFAFLIAAIIRYDLLSSFVENERIRVMFAYLSSMPNLHKYH